MRWLIGILLALNVVLLLWQGVGDDALLHNAKQAEPDIGQLRLLSEPGNAVTPPAEVAGTAAPVGTAPKLPGPATPEASPVAEQQPQPGGLPASTDGMATAIPPMAPKEPISPPVTVAPGEEGSSAAAEEAIIETTLAEPAAAESGPETSPAEAAEPTIEEEALPPSPQQSVPAPTPSSVVENMPEPVPEVCWRLGPFQDELQAQALLPELPMGVEKLAIQKVATREPNGYYVLIPALPDRGQALKTARLLKDKGIEDSWVFVSGPLKNAISLGMFSREANAKRRLDEVNARGFVAQLHPRYRQQERVALLLKGPPGGIAERSLKRLSANQMETVPCP